MTKIRVKNTLFPKTGVKIYSFFRDKRDINTERQKVKEKMRKFVKSF